MRRQVALVVQFVAGLTGFYGLGRLILGQWKRGLIEFLGLAFFRLLFSLIVLVPVVAYYGYWVGWGLGGFIQWGLAIFLTYSLWKDLKGSGHA